MIHQSLAALAFFGASAISDAPAQTPEGNNNQCVSTETKAFNATVHHLATEISDEQLSGKIDFEPLPPPNSNIAHNFLVYAYGRPWNTNKCLLALQANRLSDAEKTDLFVYLGTKNRSEGAVNAPNVGQPYNFMLDNISYEIIITKCNTVMTSSSVNRIELSITRDLTGDKNNPKCLNSERFVDAFAFNRTGITEEKLVSEKPYTVVPGTTTHIEVSRASQWEVAFEEGASTSSGGSVQGGLDLGVISGALQKSWGEGQDRSREAKFGQTSTYTSGVTLNGSVCDKWLIRHFQTKEKVDAAAPKLGITNPIKLTVVVDERVEPINLCAQEVPIPQ